MRTLRTVQTGLSKGDITDVFRIEVLATCRLCSVVSALDRDDILRYDGVINPLVQR
jgi:hypothetical protein